MRGYTITANDQVTATTCVIKLKASDDSLPFVFIPGQYAAISFYNGFRSSAVRCFSIASSPTDEGVLEFGMRTAGKYTKAISRVAIGSKVKIRGPFGGFIFNKVRDQEAVFLAGGIGITPFISMLRYLTAINATNKITLIYSCRNQDDIPYLEELKELSAKNPNIHIVFTIFEGSVEKLYGSETFIGRVTSEVINHAVNGRFDSHAFYICGPPPFMKASTQILRDNGTPESRILTEAFGQGSNRQTGKIRSWPFNIYVLGATSVVLGSFAVMVFDFLNTLPESTVLSSVDEVKESAPTNNRQEDLDKLVNNLPTLANTNSASEAVIAAKKAVASQTTTSQSSTANNTATTTSPVNTVSPTATPTPARIPVCKTSPSGVKTCK